MDHLTTVFNEADWKSTARQVHKSTSACTPLSCAWLDPPVAACRCAEFVDASTSTDPSGWEGFQTILKDRDKPNEALSEVQAMDTALARLQADIQGIEQTTCLPPSRLAALASRSERDSSDQLETVRCTVCHSLLLNAAFNDHLPSCRPCAPKSALPSKSNTSQPSSSGRQASRPGSARGRAAAKKSKGRGSKKPPAGPSRFAMEQAKPPPHRQPTPKTSSDSYHHSLAHPSQQHQLQQQQQHQHAWLHSMLMPQTDLSHSSGMLENDMPAEHLQPASMLSSEARKNPGGEEGGGLGIASWPHRTKRSRTAWAYEEHLSRSNPEMDAVNDPMLPPRFPQSVTRIRCRSRSAATIFFSFTKELQI